MKTFNAGWLFAGGALFGLSIALCVGAGAKTNAAVTTRPAAAPTALPKSAWSHLKIVGYPNGGTGFFDEETGILYVYDASLRNCYVIRQLRTLGDPMQPVN